MVDHRDFSCSSYEAAWTVLTQAASLGVHSHKANDIMPSDAHAVEDKKRQEECACPVGPKAPPTQHICKGSQDLSRPSNEGEAYELMLTSRVQEE